MITGNTVYTPRECRDAVVAALVQDKYALSSATTAYDRLKPKVGADLLQQVAKIPADKGARSRRFLSECSKHGIEVKKMTATVSSPRRAPNPTPKQGARPRSRSRSAAASRRHPESVPDGTSRTPTGSQAAERAPTQRGCDGAVALITRTPITDTNGKNHECEHVRVPFWTAATETAPKRLLVQPRVLTQLGTDRVTFNVTSAPTPTAAPVQVVKALLVEIVGAHVKPSVLKELTAGGEGALLKHAREAVARGAVTPEGTPYPNPVHDAFRTKRMREAKRVDSACGKPCWSVIVKVKPDCVLSCYRASGKGGVFIGGADLAEDKQGFAVVPLQNDSGKTASADIDNVLARAARYPQSLGLVHTQRGLYVRCRKQDLDALRTAVLGADKAERLRCDLYEVSNVPGLFDSDTVIGQLAAWAGGFPGSILETVGRPKWNKASGSNVWTVRADQAPVTALPAFVGTYRLLVQAHVDAGARTVAPTKPSPLSAWAAGPPALSAGAPAAPQPADAGATPCVYAGRSVDTLNLAECKIYFAQLGGTVEPDVGGDDEDLHTVAWRSAVQALVAEQQQTAADAALHVQAEARRRAADHAAEQSRLQAQR
eukprot:gene5127-3861_t